MSKQNVIPALACTMCLLAIAGPQANAGEVTARDLRMETRTQWDYQPGQGPRNHTTDRDFFRPTTPLPEQPMTPPPPVESGDWRNKTPRAEDMLPPPKPDIGEPKTQTSLEVGLQTSMYHYHEKDIGMKLQGPHGGVVMQATGALGGQWFARADIRAAYGEPNYKGSGEMDEMPDYIGDFRATVGRDLLWRRFGIAPYAGLGFRALYNDMRGVTTTGAHGYRRYSNVFFAPVGFQPSMRFFNGDRLTLTAEYDQLIRGWQKSMLSDAVAGYPDITNRQLTGYGLRGDLMYKHGDWSYGPFVNYWNINQSKVSCDTGVGPIVYTGCGVEPHNHTIEYGVQFRYRFYAD